LVASACLISLVGNDAAFFEVDQQHAARLQAPALDDVLVGNGEHARFRGEHDVTLLGDEIARRPQAVAVERGHDIAAVRERHGGRAVPGLHQGGVIFVEGAALSSISGLPAQASGISIMAACGSE
jgi:hypothetical protein